MKHRRVAVLRGGPSSEYEVSMQTGAGVLVALAEKGVQTIDVIVNRQGDWLVDGFVRQPEATLAACDVVFLAFHGAYGEDGTVQRLLEQLAIPYTGSRSYPSSVAMNKILAKELLQNTGIKMPSHQRVLRDEKDLSLVVGNIAARFGPGYIIKPVNGGSSHGVSLVSGKEELFKGLEAALAEREEVLVEEYIKGTEATVGVLENFREQTHYCLPVVEIVPPITHTFFASDVKYNGETEEICPGRFSRDDKSALEQAALQVHRHLDLSHYSRSDFIVNSKGVYFLEVNTLPGLTKESLLPKAVDSIGLGYNDLIVHLLERAYERGR